MKAEERDYVRYHLDQAHQSMADAHPLLDHGSLHAAVNRLYYACFYAASALLFTEGLHARKHAGVSALLHRHWVNKGLLPKELGRFYWLLFRARQEADYGEKVVFTREEVEHWLGESGAFITRTSEEIENKLNEVS